MQFDDFSTDALIAALTDPKHANELPTIASALKARVDAQAKAVADAESAVARSTELYHHAPVGYALFDEDGVIHEINSTGAKLLAAEPQALVGNSMLPYLAKADVAEFLSHLRSSFQSYEKVSVELRLVVNERPFYVRFQSIADQPEGEGQALCRTAFSDVTDFKLAEEEQRQQEAKIQHAEKLESLGVLAGGIAHDFNNILVGILGNAGLALLELDEGHPARSCIEQLETASQQAADLTNQMLAYSGRGQFVLEPVNLSALAGEMVNLLKPSISKKASIETSLEARVPPIEGDATQLRQVAMNLITNASEALHEKSGSIDVSTGVMQVSREYLAQCLLGDGRDPGLYIYIEVSDTGCGMDDDTLYRLFDPFFTTKFAGRGLGMAAVLGIVRCHHGAIAVDSMEDQGTTVRVLFPCVSSPRPKAAAPDPQQDTLKNWRGSGTVLIIEDEEAVRIVTSRLLERFGFDIITAKNGYEGVELFRKHADDIRVVLLDLTMPHMDGAEAFREIRTIREDACVILTSGFTEEDAVDKFVGMQLAGFIQKPYRPMSLIRTFHQVLGE